MLTLILLSKPEEARQILAASWCLNAPSHANTTPRVAFLRHLIALLESQPATARSAELRFGLSGDAAKRADSEIGAPILDQLKTLLTGLELPVASDVAVPWDIACFIEFLKPKLGEHRAESLTVLVAALNDRAKISELEGFPSWKNQPFIPLDVPWPER